MGQPFRRLTGNRPIPKKKTNPYLIVSNPLTFSYEILSKVSNASNSKLKKYRVVIESLVLFMKF